MAKRIKLKKQKPDIPSYPYLISKKKGLTNYCGDKIIGVGEFRKRQIFIIGY